MQVQAAIEALQEQETAPVAQTSFEGVPHM